jgi:uncharacterized protein (TIGR03435 family)
MRNYFAALIALLMLPLVATPYAQSAFEVASIKPTVTPSGVTGGCHGTVPTPFSTIDAAIPNGRCVISAARLSHLIGIAYEVDMNHVSGGPQWVWGVDRFDIQAKAENLEATHQELLLMLQQLLADRFALRFHRESRMMAGAALAVAPNGPKFKVSAAGENPPSFTASGAAINKFDAGGSKNLNLNTVIGRKMTMPQLAEALSRLPNGMPVADRTGLPGAYDFTLSWEPDEDLSRVVQEQLGLRLERQQVPVDVIVIDSATKPIAD